jgi:hypothetical protein
MLSTARTAALFAVLAAHGLSLASGQAQLVWQQDVFVSYTDEPMSQARFGIGNEIVVAGQYRAQTGANTSAALYLRSADGSQFTQWNWPISPVGVYSWRANAIDPAGNIALCGYMPSGGVIALASSGGPFLWAPQSLPATFGSAAAVTFDNNGDLLAAGTKSGDVYVVRYSPAGNLLDSAVWAHPAGGDDLPSRIAVDAQGDVYVLGFADTSGVERVYVLKLDSALNVLWERERYCQPSLDPGPHLVFDSAGNAYVACGAVPGGGSFQTVFTLWKLDPAGNTVWAATASDATHPSGRAVDVALDPFGNVVVSGSWWGSDVEGLVRSYDPAGNLRWSRPAGLANSLYFSLALDAGGDVLVAGSNGAGLLGFARRFDRQGNERWTWLDSNKTVRGAIGVAPGGDALVAASCRNSLTPNYLHEYRLGSTAFPVCAGDGSALACPCANDSLARERAGCLHSQGSAGHLDGQGSASLAADTLVLYGSGMPDSTALYFQGSAQLAPSVFGDGLRCTGGTLLRLAVRFNVGGASHFPGPGDPPLAVAGGVGSPGLRMYQAYFRDPAPFCTSATFNITNALRVNWIP